MNVHPSRQPLIRISKTGEMRLRNKIGDAILKDNAHEERALDSQLVFIKKHQARQDKYLTYRQIDFACKQIAASEERPKTISTINARKDSVLPQIRSLNLNESVSKRRTSTMAARRSNFDLDGSQSSGDFKTQQRTGKESWEKAMALIRLSLQNRQTHDAQSKQNQTFFTQHLQLDDQNEAKRKTRKEKKKMDGTSQTLPPLPQSRDSQRSRHRRGRLLSRKPSFPEMIKLSREKSMSGLQDPRFLDLESCLGGGRQSFLGRGNLRKPSKFKNGNDPLRKRKVTTFY